MDRNLLPALAAFAEVAREGNFTRAAERLNISPSALSQSMRMLEERLSLRLLNRSTRSVSVTEAGCRLLDQIAPALAVIASATTAAQEIQDRPEGLVRVNSSRAAASHFLEPHLGEFHRRYPAVRLEVLIDDSFGDIIRDGFDAGIRLREAMPDNMVAIPISPPVSMAVVGSPAYFAANPPPESPADLRRHNCIGFRHGKKSQRSPWEFEHPTTGAEILIETEGGFTTNADALMLTAALQGVGLITHLDFVVQRHLASGALIRVLKPWCPSFDGFDLYVPTRTQMPAKIRVLVDFLTEKRRLMRM